MIGVRVKTYEAKTLEEQAELMRLTIEELGNPKFPEKINVLISQTQPGESLIVMSIEPTDIKWDWPGEGTSEEADEIKRENFGRFKQPTRLFIAKRP